MNRWKRNFGVGLAIRLTFVAAWCGCVAAPGRCIANDADLQPIRGVWLANVGDDSLYSEEGINETVARCKRVGINTIFVVTWNRGVTLYPSEIMKREFGVEIDPRLDGRDPLRELVAAAHSQDIDVHAWFEFGFSSSYQEPDGGRVLRQRPGWAAMDRDGKLVERNGFQWMNGLNPEVQDFLLALMKEVVVNYDVDGVQGDDRLPGLPNTAGYDRYTIDLYKSEHNGAAPPTDVTDPQWVQWRADKLSLFVERAYHELKLLDPDLCVSWAPSVWPWSRDNYLQDWPRWVREGWGDLYCPQVYRREIDAYRATLEQVTKQVPRDKLSIIAPGQLIALAVGYDLPSSQIPAMVQINRELGFEGEVFFYHQGLEQHAAVFDELYLDPSESP